eukprot:CAMPEP_0185791974 /NCGR_PEP_ID=MMETSP1174-20130828/158673_1 /TAXON_ID=35687 /ORGANISM="Dictyocha speculum, Strain CCMP1381" /LENGTH=648 /DNA_ID=CAMNT_0028486987 /DNA_START=1519 /DNA_END=3468 /DNA_ORIENTATION=-
MAEDDWMWRTVLPSLLTKPVPHCSLHPPIGLFSCTCRRTSWSILSFLRPKDLCAGFGTTCRCAAAMAGDDWVWRTVFAHTWPCSALKPLAVAADQARAVLLFASPPSSSSVEQLASSANANKVSHPMLARSSGHWRWAAVLEANGAASEPHCFHRRTTRHEDNNVLGFGLEFTVNPKTECVDYTMSVFDVLSHAAYKDDKLRRGAWGEAFSAFLPLYLDADHFDRAWKILARTGERLINLWTQPWGTKRNSPRRRRPRRVVVVVEAVVVETPQQQKDDVGEGGGRVITIVLGAEDDPRAGAAAPVKVMNTIVVLVSDKGVAASEKALEGYCQVHRLLIAVVDRFPSLRRSIHTRLAAFLKDPSARVKEACPNLGEFLPLLSVSETVQWGHIAMPYLQENFDRGVLWACTKDAGLANVSPGDVSRLDRVLEASRTTLRLTMFHAAFLRLVARPMTTADHKNNNQSAVPLAHVADMADVTLGRPPLHLRRRWQRVVRRILGDLLRWPGVFVLLGVACPHRDTLLQVLEGAVSRSLKKGYHRDGQDFSAVHRSGVSKILLKGESYTAPPNLKRVRLHERWRFDSMEYLDASCLAYDKNGASLGFVDWSHTSALQGLHHGGDVIDHEKCMGTHTIEVDLVRLPAAVTDVYFT